MKSLLKIATLLKPFWKLTLLGPLLMVLEVAMDLLQPRLMQHIVDQGITQLDTSIIFNTSLMMVLLSFVGLIGGVGGGIFAVKASQLFGAELRSKLFRKVLSLSFGDLDRIGTGELITRITNDVTQVQHAILLCLIILVRTPLIIVGSIIMATLTSPKLAVIFLVIAPLIAIIMIFVSRKTYRTFSQVQQRVDQLNTVMLENFAGIRVVKAYVRSAYEKKRFDHQNKLLTNNMVSALQISALGMPATMLILNLGVVGVIWFGGLQVNQGLMKMGEIIAFINYITYLLFSVMMVSMVLTRISRAAASVKRLLEILEAEPEVHDSDKQLDAFDIQGRIVFNNVSFNYNEQSAPPVLDNISFVAEQGQMTAILGTTGAGKSTLVNLIPRFYDPSSGHISIDGVDIQHISPKLLHKHIGIALQEVVLFSGTIADNIAYGCPDASLDEIINAAKSAQADAFIRRFPDGYDTVLGQRGINLSGGQKQRIAIARALITLPKILILDDSTSAIDVKTESRLQLALTRLMKGRTSIIIAQRISSVLNADNIIVLDNGKIAAQGTHDELLLSSALYGEIYTSQLGNEAIDNV